MNKLTSAIYNLTSKIYHLSSKIYHLKSSLRSKIKYLASRRRKVLAVILTILLLTTSLRLLFLNKSALAAWSPTHGDWAKRKLLTVTNNSSDSLASGTTIAITVNTKELYDSGKLQDDCDDLRILYQPNSTTYTELTRHLVYPPGTTCVTSEATKVYFQLQAALGSGSSSTDYYSYYSHPHATTPSSTDDVFDVGSKNALLVCPFDGSTTCVAGEAPSTESGAIRYSGSKSALSFDSENDEVNFGNDNYMEALPDGDMTIEWWQYFKGNENFDLGDTVTFNINSDNGGWRARVHNNNFIQYEVDYNNQDALYQTSNGTVTRNQWQHIAVVWTASTKSAKIYIDGTEPSYQTTNAGQGTRVSDNGGILKMGVLNYACGACRYGGLLDEVRVSNTKRYSAEFTQPTAPFVRDEHTLILTHFDENGDDPRNTGKVIDDSGNDNHGTITGTKYVAGLVGIDSSTSDTGNVSGQSFAGHEGIFIEEATTNKVTNPSFENSTFYSKGWTGAKSPSVQNDSVTLSGGSSSVNDTITEVDPERAFLVFGTSFDNAQAACSQISGKIVNGTTLTFERYDTCAGVDIAIEWYVAEFETGVYVQRGTENMTGYQTKNITISNVDTSKSFPIISHRTRGSTYNDDDFVRAKITSSTNLELLLNSAADGMYAYTEWQVVEFQDTSVQTGDVSFGTTDSSQPDTLSPSVDTTKSWLVFSSKSDDGTYADIGQKMLRGVITNGTTVTFDRDNTGQATQLTWYLVEFTDTTSVQDNTENFTSSDTYKDVTITSITQSRTIAATAGWIHHGGKTPYSTDDNPGVGSVTSDFTSGTNLRLTRGLAGSTTADVGWFVTQFGSDNLTATENTTAPYYKFGSKSVQLVASGTPSGASNDYTIDINPGNTNTHTLSLYIYDGTSGNIGGAVDNTIAELVWEGTSQPSATYTDMGGGWWRISYSAATTNSTNAYGLMVEDGKTIYLDGVQLEEKAYATTYTDGTLGTDYSWSGTAHDSTSSRTKADLRYSNTGNISASGGTVSLWFKIEQLLSSSLSQELFKWGTNSGDRIGIFTLGEVASNALRLDFYTDSGTGRSCGTITQDVDPGEWHHVVVTYTTNSAGSDGCQWYYDSTYATSGSSGQTWSFNPSTAIGVGVYPENNAVTGGKSISDLRIWDTALTDAEITDLYQAGLVSHQQQYEVDRFSENKGQNPVAIWHFDKSYGSTANDSSIYGNHLTVYGATWETQSVGAKARLLRNLEFDGTNDSASRSGELKEFNFGTDGFSIGGWFRHTSSISGTDTILSRYGDAGYKVYMNSSGYVCAAIDDDSTWSPGDETCSTSTQGSLADSQWHHFEAVKDGSTSLTIYIDGVQANYDDGITASGSLNSSADIIIGADNDNDDYWSGFLDELVIYPYARTADQIKADVFGPQSAAFFGAETEDWLSEGLVGYWKMDDNVSGDGETIVDLSGNGNDGTTEWGSGSGMDCTVSGKYGPGCDFDGSDDYIYKNSASNLAVSSCTISFWYKTDDYDPRYDFLYLWQTEYQEFLKIARDWQGDINLYIEEGDQVKTNLSTAYDWEDTNWHQVAVTQDGNGAKIFVDGIKRATTGTNSSYCTAHLSPLNVWIGRASWAYPTDGLIDEVRIYNRALTPAEVADLYRWAPGPIGYWPMDEGSGTSAYDKSGNGYTGTWAGSGTPRYVNGKYGMAGNFNGSSDWIYNGSIGNSLDLISTTPPSFTEEAWFNISNTNNLLSLVCDGAAYCTGANNPTNNYDARLGQTGGKLFFQLVAGSTYVQSLDDTPLNTWTHVAGVYESDTNLIKLYVNGIYQGSATPATTDFSGDAMRLSIGQAQTYLQGNIDEVRVYNYARTQEQIVEDMNAGHPAPGSPIGSPVGYWRFDEGYGDTASDFGTGGNNGNLAGAITCPQSGDSACPSWTNSGKFGKALDFDTTGATDDYVSIANPVITNTQFTISAWANMNGIGGGSSNQNTIFEQRDDTSGDNYSTVVLHAERDNSSIETRFYVRSSNGAGQTVDADRPDYNGWHHYLGVVDSDYIYLYIDGALKNKITNNQSGNYNTSIDYTDIGRHRFSSSDAGFFNGQIDEVKIYNFALTADQVKILYNQGAGVVMGAMGTDSSGNPSYSSERSYCPPGDTTSSCAPVGEWKLDENAGTGTDAVKDTSGNDNNGDTNGLSEGSWIPGKVGSALEFDGTDDWVDFGSDSSLDNMSTWTYEAWIYPISIPASDQAFFIGKASYGAGEKYLGFDNSGTGAIHCKYEDPGGSMRRRLTNETLSTGEWTHVACTADPSASTDFHIYINGVEATYSTTTNGTAAKDDDTENLRIGANHDGNYDFNGLLDEVWVYNYVRTPAQIAWDYNRGKPVGYWNLDECTGTDAYDYSGNGNDGTITIGGSGDNHEAGACSSGDTTDAWYNGRDGKRNASLDFDGTDDWVNVDNFPKETSQVSGTAWVYANSRPSWATIAKNWGGSIKGQLHLGLEASDGDLSIHITQSNDTKIGPVREGTSNLFPLGSWQHVAFVADGSYLKLYRNGVEVGTPASYDGTLKTSFACLGMGAKPNDTCTGNSAGFWDGQIDEVRIYNYALTEEQILNEYNQGSIFFGPSEGPP